MGRAPREPDWSGLADACRDAGGRIDQSVFSGLIAELAAGEYRQACPSAELVEFEHGSATYLFDCAGSPQAERTVLAVAHPHPQPPATERDASYQRGYPLAVRASGRPLDRGHFVPHSGSGLYGPNLFPQDRALNRGWSVDGGRYRALEETAVHGAPESLFFARPLYIDESDFPEFIELGTVIGWQCEVQRFRNRFENLAREDLDGHLAAAVSSQIGALGEEAAAVLIEEQLGGQIVAMGDAGLPRDGAAQDLDLLAIVDDALIAYEVKTRYLSRLAGRLTRAGDLRRPRLRSPRIASGSRQGSQPYVAERLSGYLELDDDYNGITVRVIALDLRLMLAQEFSVNDSGTRLTPLGRPVDCRDAATTALGQILDHRGYL
jgi:hypothetical protein